MGGISIWQLIIILPFFLAIGAVIVLVVKAANKPKPGTSPRKTRP